MTLPRHADWSSGPDQDRRWYLETEPSAKIADATEEWTFAAPAGTLSEEASYRLPETSNPRDISTAKLAEALLAPVDGETIDHEVLRKLRNAADRSGDPGDRWQFADGGFGPEDFEAIDGEFPSPHERLIRVADGANFGIPDAPRESSLGAPPDRYNPPVQAAFFVDSSEEITGRVWGPDWEVPMAPPTIYALADPDGDGTEGLLYRTVVGRSQTDRWLDFRGGSPQTDELTHMHLD